MHVIFQGVRVWGMCRVCLLPVIRYTCRGGWVYLVMLYIIVSDYGVFSCVIK
jgi:hypothetical protein